MKSKVIGSIIAMVLVLGHTAQGAHCVKGNGHISEESRAVKPFHALHVGGVFKLAVICNEPFSLYIRADDNLIPHIDTEVRDHILYIDTRTPICTDSPMTISLSLPVLKAIDLFGAADAEISGIITEALTVRIAGAADLQMRGEAERLRAKMSGSSDLDASGLAIQSADIRISGAAEASLHVVGDLKAEVNGAASLRCTEAPRSVDAMVSGAGSINCDR
jgi:uncharacterized protein YaiE (UPF0345 family)